MATPITNYDGFTNQITIRGIPLVQSHPGKVFWVGNGSVMGPGQINGSNNNKGTFNAPWSTLAYALTNCVAERGDIIMVKPGHAENLATAAVVTMTKAGVAVVGLGTGAARPTFSWSAVAGTWAISAANCSLTNLRFIANFADVTTMFDLAAGADGLSFENCYFADTSSILNWIDCITAATGVDDISFRNCRWNGVSASNDAMFTGVAHNGFFMEDCYVASNIAQTSVIGLLEATGNVTNCWIKNTVFRSNIDGAKCIDFQGTACSGAVTNCYFSSIDIADAISAGVNFTGGHCFECYFSGEADLYGIVGGGASGGPYVNL